MYRNSQCQTKVTLVLIAMLNLLDFSSCIDASLEFYVDGKGFHRNFVYHVNVKESHYRDCYVSLDIRLPSAVYVNVDEAADLQRIGKTTACLLGETNVELFAEKAGPQNLSLCAPLEQGANVLTIPVHQRYQNPRVSGGYVITEIAYPKLLFGCKNSPVKHVAAEASPCRPCADLAAEWQEIPYEQRSNYVWKIPVGDSSYAGLVSFATLLITSLGAVAVLITITPKTDKDEIVIKNK